MWLPIEKVNKNQLNKLDDLKQRNKLERSLSGHHTTTCIKCETMPPLSLNIFLPASYPSDTQPMFTLSCFWLNKKQLSNICVQLDKIWEEYKGMAVIYTWIEWLQINMIKYLDIIDEPDKLIVSPLGEYSNEEEQNDRRAVATFDDIEHCTYEFLRFNYLTSEFYFTDFFQDYFFEGLIIWKI